MSACPMRLSPGALLSTGLGPGDPILTSISVDAKGRSMSEQSKAALLGGLVEWGWDLMKFPSGEAVLDAPSLNPLSPPPRDRLYSTRFRDGCGILEVVEQLGPWHI